MSASLPRPVLLAGCGNALVGEDAFGPLVTEALAAAPPPGLEILDLGTNPSRLLDHLALRRALLIVDAAWSPDHSPGELLNVDFSAPVSLSLCSDRAVSTHAFGVARQLELGRALGILPPVVRLIALVARSGAPGALQRPAKHLIADAVRHVRVWTADLLSCGTAPTSRSIFNE